MLPPDITFLYAIQNARKQGYTVRELLVPPVTVLPRKCYRCPDFSPHLRRFYIENVTGGSACERKILF
jgi:hypothetical protein